jgi:hypothetical protein
VSFSERRPPSRCQPCPLRLGSVSTPRFRCTRRSPLLTIVNYRTCRTAGCGSSSSTENITIRAHRALRASFLYNLRVSPIRRHRPLVVLAPARYVICGLSRKTSRPVVNDSMQPKTARSILRLSGTPGSGCLPCKMDSTK